MIRCWRLIEAHPGKFSKSGIEGSSPERDFFVPTISDLTHRVRRSTVARGPELQGAHAGSPSTGISPGAIVDVVVQARFFQSGQEQAVLTHLELPSDPFEGELFCQCRIVHLARRGSSLFR